ncbi:MAG: hypothetical protein U0528_13390 [Anaerolineae bacterium]
MSFQKIINWLSLVEKGGSTLWELATGKRYASLLAVVSICVQRSRKTEHK